MTEKRLGLKSLDYATDVFVNIFEPIAIDDPTPQEEWVTQKIKEVLEDFPKKKVGYLVMEMKDKGDVDD